MLRIIKLGLISFVFFFLLITGISLFIPSHIRISKAINIGTKKDSVLNKIADIGNWKHWYPGFDTLPLLELDKKGNQLHSAKTKGITIVLGETSDTLITASFKSNKKRPVSQSWRSIVHPLSDSITLQWYMDFHLRWYPWEKFSSLLFEKRYGPQMEQGLTNLKTLLEK